MKKTVRFSKDYKEIFNLKTDFYNNNKSNLINASNIIRKYSPQEVTRDSGPSREAYSGPVSLLVVDVLGTNLV